MERFAAGIEAGVYDYELFVEITGVTTAKLYLQIHNLIKESKYTDNQTYIFCEKYKKLCKRLLTKFYSGDYRNKKKESHLLTDLL